MLNSNTLRNYLRLKTELDATYLVFKKEPSILNATRHTAAAQAFNTFCVDTMAELAGVTDETPNKQAEILANFDQYKVCNKCEDELLFKVNDQHFIESTGFVPDFKGWCHTCLVAHCCNTECTECTVAIEQNYDTADCPYKEVKKLYDQI